MSYLSSDSVFGKDNFDVAACNNVRAILYNTVVIALIVKRLVGKLYNVTP